uniref:translation initiation factor IF-2-like n=1 Tax=Callithrix jacchus TaxID=9483 RepID=UPI0023DD560F|nr:translation initiation factor IF-2-like [Callithrix jacchus]
MNEPTVQPTSQTPNRNNCYIPFQALGLLTPTPCSEENWTARPSRQYDIKKKGGEEEEGAEPKESAPSTNQSPPPDRISEAAGDCSKRAPRHGIPARPRQRTPQRGRNASETRAVVAEAHSGNRDLVGSFPTQMSKRQARPAPSPNTHSRSTTTRAARPGSSPRPHGAGPNVKPTTQAPRGQQLLSGVPAGNRASLPPQRRGQRRECRRADSQPNDLNSPGVSQSWTPGVPAPGLSESP